MHWGQLTTPPAQNEEFELFTHRDPVSSVSIRRKRNPRSDINGFGREGPEDLFEFASGTGGFQDSVGDRCDPIRPPSRLRFARSLVTREGNSLYSRVKSFGMSRAHIRGYRLSVLSL
jgi:hypothetical protein